MSRNNDRSLEPVPWAFDMPKSALWDKLKDVNQLIAHGEAQTQQAYRQFQVATMKALTLRKVLHEALGEEVHGQPTCFIYQHPAFVSLSAGPMKKPSRAELLPVLQISLQGGSSWVPRKGTPSGVHSQGVRSPFVQGELRNPLLPVETQLEKANPVVAISTPTMGISSLPLPLAASFAYEGALAESYYPDFSNAVSFGDFSMAHGEWVY